MYAYTKFVNNQLLFQYTVSLQKTVYLRVVSARSDRMMIKRPVSQMIHAKKIVLGISIVEKIISVNQVSNHIIYQL